MTKEAVVRITYKSGVVVDVCVSGDIEEFVVILKKDKDVQNVETAHVAYKTARKNYDEYMKKRGC
jgi:hypothetical protein